MASRQPCPKCGEPWVPWDRSDLKTHAKCHFEPAVQNKIMREWERPGTTIKMLAVKYGVSTGVIRASVHAAMRRLGKQGLRA